LTFEDYEELDRLERERIETQESEALWNANQLKNRQLTQHLTKENHFQSIRFYLSEQKSNLNSSNNSKKEEKNAKQRWKRINEEFKLENDVLFKLHKKKTNWLKVLESKEIIKEVLKEVHGHSHFGRDKMMAQISSQYFMHDVRKNVNEFVSLFQKNY
jgi:hypothetical protein